MSLLTAVSNVAREAGYGVDSTTVTGATDVTTKQIWGIADRIIREMFEAYPWPKLNKSSSITLVSAQSAYEKPGDWSSYHYETWWNQSDSWRVFGPMSPQEYAEIQGYQLTEQLYDRFMIRGQADADIILSPTPDAGTAGQVIIFEYISARPVRPRTWEAGQTITSGDYTFYDGVYYTASTSGTTTGSTGPAGDSITWTVYSGKYETFLADTDEPVLSQRVLEQGMLERFAEIHGLSVAPRFEVQLNEDFSRAIPGKLLFAGGKTDNRYQFARNGSVVFGGLYGR